MRVGALLPLVVFVLVVGGVGWRMLSLWRRTRELPELALGLSLVCMAGIATPLTAVGRLPALAETLTGRAIFSLGIAFVALGVGTLFVFTGSVFQRGATWARALVAASGVALAVCVVPIVHANLAASRLEEILPRMTPWTLCLLGLLALCFLWNAIEAVRHHRSLRRRLALGLADPVLVDRFLLWAIASAASVVLVGAILACMRAGMVVIREPVSLSLMAVAGAVMSVAWYLTFFAPRRYQRFVRERAEPRLGA